MPPNCLWSFHWARPSFTAAIMAVVMVIGAKAEQNAPGVSINFDLPKSGRVSLALYDSEGRMVRTLLTGKPTDHGKHVIHWDGLDRYGNPVPAGEYAWKMLVTSGLRAEFITQVGQNVEPPWERATGNHEPPVGAAIDSTGLYRVGATNEGGHYAVKTDLDGKHLWATDRYAADPWAVGTVAIALINNRLFELMPNGDVYGYEARTGNVFTGGNFDPKPWNLCWQGYEPPPEARDEEKRRLRAGYCPSDLAGDAESDLIIASYPRYDAIAWYSASDGKLVATVKDIKDLAGIAAGRGGKVFAISRGAVISLGQSVGEPQVIISREHLEYPWRLTVDPQSGDLLVAENSFKFPGASMHHQVKRFSSDGKLLQIYGKPEGRTDGAYVSTDFRGVTDIESDGSCGFIVTEGNHTPPRRTARFDRDGNLTREWFGCQHYGVIACPEPNDPRFVWTRANAETPGLLRWEIDYTNKTSRLVEVYQDVFARNRFLRNNSAHGSAVPTVFEHRGRHYISNGAMGSLVLLQYDPAAKRIRPCNASAGADSLAIIWNDLNDDGQLSEDEIHQTNRNIIGGYIDPSDLSIRTTPYATRFQAGDVFKPIRFTDGGTPLYDASESIRSDAWHENGERFHPLDFRKGADGSIYGSISDAVRNPNEGTETHGVWYYNSCSAIDRLVKWGPDGNPLWSVGRHSPDVDHETGSTAMPRGLVGLVHGCVVWADASDEEVARPTVWTEDGLYIDELLRVPADALPKEVFGMFNTNEYPTGHLAVDPMTGDTYYYAINSGGGSPIYRITGWDRWDRHVGKIVLRTAASQVATLDGHGLKGEYFSTPDCSGEPVLTRLDPLIYFNWGKTSPDEKLAHKSFSARWSGTYEAATNEDVRFEVRGSFPWRDRGRPIYVKLWLNDKLVIDSKDEQSYVRVRLSAGQRVDLKLECGFLKGEAAVALSHDTPGIDRRAVLPKYFHEQSRGRCEDIEVVSEPRRELIAHFDFEQPDTLLYRSTTGGDVFGRLTGLAKPVAGRFGQGIELTSKGAFLPALFPIDEELQLPDSDYAVSFWFNTNAENVQLCEARRYSSYNNRWSDHTVLLENGMLSYRLKGATTLTGRIKVNDALWHHVVTSVGVDGHRLYLDGKLVDSGEFSKRLTNCNRLGLDIGPGVGSETVMFDDVRVLGDAPSPEDVLKLFLQER